MPFRGFYNVMDVFPTWGFEGGTRPIRTGAQWKSFWFPRHFSAIFAVAVVIPVKTVHAVLLLR